MKRTFSTELAYVFGIVFVALGVVLMEKADFGVSMVVAPAYLLYRWLSPVWSFVTFGMAEYCLQAVLLLVMCLLLRHTSPTCRGWARRLKSRCCHPWCR